MMVKVEVVGIVKHTEKAVLVEVDNGRYINEVWLPRAQAKPLGYKDDEGKAHITAVKLPYWLAKQNGLLAVDGQGMYMYNVTMLNE